MMCGRRLEMVFLSTPISAAASICGILRTIYNLMIC